MAVFLAISSGTFLLALNYTTVANVLFMQAAAPMMAALLGWVFLSEKIDAWTALALALAGVGVLLMAAGSFDAGVAGVVLLFVMTASFAVVIVIARHRREVSMMPATATSQVLVVLACAPCRVRFREPGRLGDPRRTGRRADGPRPRAPDHRRAPDTPAQVAVISLLEIVLGPLWVWSTRSAPRRRR